MAEWSSVVWLYGILFGDGAVFSLRYCVILD